MDTADYLIDRMKLAVPDNDSYYVTVTRHEFRGRQRDGDIFINFGDETKSFWGIKDMGDMEAIEDWIDEVGVKMNKLGAYMKANEILFRKF